MPDGNHYGRVCVKSARRAPVTCLWLIVVFWTAGLPDNAVAIGPVVSGVRNNLAFLF
ncbi:hypothetical protein KCP76_04770 [Salmonella enterica subsp. enterica serovar Weltevreden]|nr:hypothetical protein KCP76_04770 [Salmonella enterica subsp. enterica serovar Weltevreden]